MPPGDRRVVPGATSGQRGPVVDPFLQQAALAEAARRQEARVKVDLSKLCFPEQLRFVTDPEPFIAGLCSRRAGKSEGVSLKMIATAQRHPGRRIPYVTLTRPMAKNIMWGKLQRWNAPPRRDEWGEEVGGLDLGAHFNNQTLEMTLPNGSVIFLASAETGEEVEKLRGGDYPLVVLDECQAFKPALLRTLLEDILPYALFEHGGQLVVIGTPSPQCAGYFYRVTEGQEPGWSVHRWTMFQNAKLPRNPRTGVKGVRAAEVFAEDFLRRRKLSRDAARVQREMYGRWVRDNSSSVYRVEPRSLVRELPTADDWEHVIGVDYGYRDATAFAVLAYSVALGRAVVVRAFERTGLLPSDAAEVLRGLYEEYDPVHMVGDAGGLGKPYVEEAVQRYDLPLEPAEKARKLAAIEFLNDDLETGALTLLEPCEELFLQMRQLEWDYAKADRKRGGDDDRPVQRADVAIADRTPDHMCDAVLYAHRACRQYLHTDPAETGAEAHPLTAEERRMWEAAARTDALLRRTDEELPADESLLTEGLLGPLEGTLEL